MAVLLVMATPIAVVAATPVAHSVSFVSATVPELPMPESKGRKGSKRVGGYNSKGKGSHYVGGRR